MTLPQSEHDALVAKGESDRRQGYTPDPSFSGKPAQQAAYDKGNKG